MGKPADGWWLWRGTQSAIFFYASCGPCSIARERKQRKKEAIRNKKEKEAFRQENPEIYHHPAPTETNPHWQEEMRIGPNPTPKRARNRTRDSNNTATGESVGSSVTDLVPAQEQPRELIATGPGWNKKRYHRPDEEFEEEMEEEPIAIDLGPDATGTGSRLTTVFVQKPERSHLANRAPEINEMHPPVVSVIPEQWHARQWMKAPPPSAKFMNGEKGVTSLNRNDSYRSARTGASPRVAASTSPRSDGQDDYDDNSEYALEDWRRQRRESRRIAKSQERSGQNSTPSGTPRRHRSRRVARPKDSLSSSDSDFDLDDERLHPFPVNRPKPSFQRNISTLPRRSRPASHHYDAFTGAALSPSPPNASEDETNPQRKTLQHLTSSSRNPQQYPTSHATTSRDPNPPYPLLRSKTSAGPSDSFSPSSTASIKPLPQLKSLLDSSLNALSTVTNLPSLAKGKDPAGRQDQSGLPLELSDSMEVLDMEGRMQGGWRPRGPMARWSTEF